MSKIGVFDSGVGGLSVLRTIRNRLPRADLVYFADQAHVPYGPRSMEEVRDFSEAITRYLISQSAQVLVVACNTASAAGLHYLRETFPDVLAIVLKLHQLIVVASMIFAKKHIIYPKLEYLKVCTETIQLAQTGWRGQAGLQVGTGFGGRR